jgi:hypothetical protein
MAREAGMRLGKVRRIGTNVMKGMLHIESCRAGIQPCKTCQRYSKNPKPKNLHPVIPSQRKL